MVSDIYRSQQFPSKLDYFIFNNLNGIYNPEHERAYENEDADTKKTKENLGTYFPRSFLEMYIIFKDLINNEHIKNIFEKSEFFILDIGGGVGGNLLGLLWFMKDNVKDFKSKKIHVISLDCNDIALDNQEIIIKKFFPAIDFYSKNPKLSYNNFNEILRCVSEDYRFISYNYNYKNKFDLILTFKFINELYRQFQDYKENKGLYNKITCIASDYLDENGLFILADPADKNKAFRYFPKMMNEEISMYLTNNSENLRVISPLSCAFWYMNCKKACYTQTSFKIKTSKENRESKLSYKIMAHKAMAERILKQIHKEDCYYIGKGNTCERGNSNPDPSGQRFKDAFSYYNNMNKDDIALCKFGSKLLE